MYIAITDITFLPLHRKIVWIQEIPYPSQGRFLHQFGFPHASGNSNLASKSKGIHSYFFPDWLKKTKPFKGKYFFPPPPPQTLTASNCRGLKFACLYVICA